MSLSVDDRDALGLGGSGEMGRYGSVVGTLANKDPDCHDLGG